MGEVFARAYEKVDEKLAVVYGEEHRWLKLGITVVVIFLFFFMLWPLGAFSCAIGLCVGDDNLYGSGIVLLLVIVLGIMIVAAFFVVSFYVCAYISGVKERRRGPGPVDGLGDRITLDF
jgi:cellulose synthase/poly-beta-1,6-N-acetylglucosamine synthase-like glycosyltransferase